MNLDLVRDKVSELPVLDDPQGYISAKIWHCGYKSLEKVGQLKNLKNLTIATLPDDNLDFLTSLSRLEYLQIIHLPNINSLITLSQLTSLRELSLETLPSWDSSSRQTVVESLTPLENLQFLEKLTLYSVIPADKDYLCLMNCNALRELNIQRGHKNIKESLRALHANKPGLSGNFLKFI